jgi:hypothetical protein
MPPYPDTELKWNSVFGRERTEITEHSRIIKKPA